MSIKRFLITWCDWHGVRHQCSRHKSKASLMAELGITDELEWELSQ